jgi:MoaA/NifB/PqqE/SkfB family radical SAM enzyme
MNMKNEVGTTGFSEINQARLHYHGYGFWYCEIALTGDCNFNCHYCNGFQSDVDHNEILTFIQSNSYSLRHVQLTGGEPTLYPHLSSVCKFITDKGVRVGLSTNGSADFEFYKSLNVDMFSISLDDYDYDTLIRRGYVDPCKIFSNIIKLSKIAYVNIGLVIDSINVDRIRDIICYILAMGVADIKLSISTKDEVTPSFGNLDFSKYPILNYRVNRFRQGLSMRGVQDSDSFKCHLVKNDVSIVGRYHYPCLVYAREGGKPIGSLKSNVRLNRTKWFAQHNPVNDPICKKYCMDFKCAFNRERHVLEQEFK